MEKNKETYYQRLILEDIKNPRNTKIAKILPWIIGSFFVLQVIYYFVFFHHRIWNKIAIIKIYHTHDILLVRPKSIVFNYDDLLVFVLYLVFVFISLILSFIAFDSSQRNKVIKRLMDKNQENQKDA